MWFVKYNSVKEKIQTARDWVNALDNIQKQKITHFTLVKILPSGIAKTTFVTIDSKGNIKDTYTGRKPKEMPFFACIDAH
jgi:hypothetical protein